VVPAANAENAGDTDTDTGGPEGTGAPVSLAQASTGRAELAVTGNSSRHWAWYLSVSWLPWC
jgi:hypothetical protein